MLAWVPLTKYNSLDSSFYLSIKSAHVLSPSNKSHVNMKMCTVAALIVVALMFNRAAAELPEGDKHI